VNTIKHKVSNNHLVAPRMEEEEEEEEEGFIAIKNTPAGMWGVWVRHGLRGDQAIGIRTSAVLLVHLRMLSSTRTTEEM